MRDIAETIELVIKVENAYSDGHESEQTRTVEVAEVLDEDQLWDELYEYTGDGHGQDRPDLGSCHTVTVVASPHRPDLLGLDHEYIS